MTRDPITIRAAKAEDWLTWERMRYALWPGDYETHGEQIRRFFAGEKADPQHVLLAADHQEIVGFAEVSIREDLPGMEGSRIGYIEGLYVVPGGRHQGVAAALIAASSSWAREQRCVGFASDRDDRIVIDRRFTQRA